jgi:uncharacterized YccA/Bax inhibitor family protein
MAAESARGERVTVGDAALLLVVVAGIVAGLVLVFLGQWRLGSVIIGAILTIGGLIRMMLPKDWTGLLQARSRFVDVITLLLMGVLIMVLAIAVPD